MTDPQSAKPFPAANETKGQRPVETPPSGEDLESGQTLAEDDQTLTDSDQTGADGDQSASDRDLADGGDPEVHDTSRDIRDRSAHKRRAANRKRAEVAATRDSAPLAVRSQIPQA